MNSEEGKLLGKNIEYPKTYCPEILVAVPRSLNREAYSIKQENKIFHGFDTWHAYEASFILNNGMPVAGILKIVYSSDSEYIVESKSLKLYLASFNMYALGNTLKEGIKQYTHIVEQDLSLLLHTIVKVYFYESYPKDLPFDFKDYTLVEKEIDYTNLKFTDYKESPLILQENINSVRGELKVCSHLLKSNCKITNQPDWGNIYIRIKGNQLPSLSSLLKYIVSMRNENHFHEEICEMTYKRLYDIFQPEILMVCCLYTRRGGIDICPSRSNKEEYLPTYLKEAKILTLSSFRQ